MRPSIADLPWPVRTDRLLLRPGSPDDAAALWRYHGLDEVREWLIHRPADAAAFASALAEPDRLAGLLVVELDERVIADLYVAVGDAWAQPEVDAQAAGVEAVIGWVLDPAYAGRGFATEACTALLELCFDGLGVRRVVANSFADNTASTRLMERLGMRREALNVRDSLHHRLGWVDGCTYALLADEWRSRRVHG